MLYKHQVTRTEAVPITTQLTTTPSVPATELTFADVFDYPQYSLRGLTCWQEVAKLGRNNIEALISKARRNEQSLTGQIGRLKEKQDALRGKSGEDFVEMAKEYENPTLNDVGVPAGGWGNDLEPLDAASKNREGGATTFNVCGWCKHAGGGSCRFQYHITTSCGLLSDDGETKFNTPCLLHSKSAEEISAEADMLDGGVKETLAHRERVREGIKLLQKLKNGTAEKPYLISLMPHDHFNVGDDVLAYVGQWGEESEHKCLVKDGVWVPAHVIFGYRHHDGCVSYQALFPVHSNTSFAEGRGGGVGMSRPELLKKSTFSYLKDASENDPTFFQLWVNNIKGDIKGLDVEVFATHIKSGEIASPPEGWVPPEGEVEVKTKKDAERVLQCLDADLFKSEKEIKDWAAMQLRYVHPNKHAKADGAVKNYAEQQTKAVFAARDLLIARLKGRSK